MKIDDEYRAADKNGKLLLERAREFMGRYVRLKLAPNTRMGTIVDGHLEEGHVEYLLHHDQRFDDKLPDFYIYEDDFEICEPPTDEFVVGVNALVRNGS